MEGLFPLIIAGWVIYGIIRAMNKPRMGKNLPPPKQHSSSVVMGPKQVKRPQGGSQSQGIRSLEEMLQILTQPEGAARLVTQQPSTTSAYETAEGGPSYEQNTSYENLPSLESQLSSVESLSPIYEDLEEDASTEEGHRLVTPDEEATPLHARQLHKSHGLSTSTALTGPSLAQQLLTSRADLRRALIGQVILERPYE